MAAALFLFLSTSVASAQDATVPGDFPDLPSAIREAVDLDGDGRTTVLVRPGTYAGDLLVMRSDFHLQGSGADVTEIRGSGLVDTVRVLGASRVTLSGLRVTGATSGSGVALVGTDGCRVDRCEVTRNLNGVTLMHSANDGVRGTLVHANAGHGIELLDARGAGLTRNDVTGNGRNGIRVRRAGAIRIERNLVHGNGTSGIDVQSLAASGVAGNVLKDNGGDGIRLEKAFGNVLQANVSMFNAEDGLHLRSAEENVIAGNVLTSNDRWGIHAIAAPENDFGAQPGKQPAPGSNEVAANGSGPVLVEG